MTLAGFAYNVKTMKPHLYIAIGLTLGVIFIIQGYSALTSPGFGFRELYILGGVVFSYILVSQGLKSRRENE